MPRATRFLEVGRRVTSNHPHVVTEGRDRLAVAGGHTSDGFVWGVAAAAYQVEDAWWHRHVIASNGASPDATPAASPES